MIAAKASRTCGIAVCASMQNDAAMQSVIETSIFTRRADSLLTREERAERRWCT